MRRTLLLLAVLAWTCCLCHGAPAVIKGKATQYANHTIVFCRYADYVSRLQEELLSVRVGADGTFQADIDIDEVTEVWTDLGHYRGYIYLEPGITYEITLPPFRKRSDADRFNPYFQPQEVALGLRSTTSDLNVALRRFDAFFTLALAQNAHSLARRSDKALADKLMARADSASRAIGCKKAFFRNHVTYRKAQFWAAARVLRPELTLREFYVGRPVLYNCPAYWETLNMIDPNVLMENRTHGLDRQVERTLHANTASFANLSNVLSRDTLLAKDRNLREMLIIRSLRNAIYTKKISESRSDSLLTDAASHCNAKRNRLAAANLYARKNKVRAGLPAPELRLVDNEDRSVNLADYRGKFVYLCFMHTENYECVRAMQLLDNMVKVHGEDLQILCIFTDDDSDNMYKSLAKRNYKWRGVSFVANQGLLTDYVVPAIPSYYIIAPDGTIAMPYAPSPLEKAGPTLADMIRDYKAAKLRGTNAPPRTIYDIANSTKQ